jgi:hypothetical protein
MKNPIEFKSLLDWGEFAHSNFSTSNPQSVCIDRIVSLRSSLRAGSKGVDLLAEEFEHLSSVFLSPFTVKQIRAFIVFPLGYSPKLSEFNDHWLSAVNLAGEPPSIHLTSSCMPLALEGEEYIRYMLSGTSIGEIWALERAFYRCWRTEAETREGDEFTLDLYVEAFRLNKRS